MRHQSEKHYKVVEEISLLVNGKNIDSPSLKKGKIYPDISIKDRDIEVEMMNTSNLRRKCKLYDKARKRTMVIVIPDYVLDCFDKVVLWKD